MLQSIIVKEFLETAKEEFEEKWKNPHKVSWFSLFFSLFISVQDFLDKAKKEFEEQWSKNIKVRTVVKDVKLTKKDNFYILLTNQQAC